jgi:hypothetical protein
MDPPKIDIGLNFDANKSTKNITHLFNLFFQRVATGFGEHSRCGADRLQRIAALPCASMRLPIRIRGPFPARR